jgi:hypothetical protein
VLSQVEGARRSLISMIGWLGVDARGEMQESN